MGVPDSTTRPVLRPDEYRDNTPPIEILIAGGLKVSNRIWAVFSRFAFGFKTGSVIIIALSSGATLSSL